MTNKIARLVEIMAALRTPGTGCPWDLEQTFASIAPYTIEEAYEVADAIERGDLDDLRDELGDLLLQVVFHARMAEEQDAFTFADVTDAITGKLIRRHPHVFEETNPLSSEAVATQWSDIKAREKRERARKREAAGPLAEKAPSLLDGVPLALPALARAVKLQEKAGRVGFDWANPHLVLAKIREEVEEAARELPREPGDATSPALVEEIGDLLFAIANLARHVGADPEQALRAANVKFERRFKFIEQRLEQEGKTLEQSSLDEMEALWTEAKVREKEKERK